jgi:hypothetical protein
MSRKGVEDYEYFLIDVKVVIRWKETRMIFCKEESPKAICFKRNSFTTTRRRMVWGENTQRSKVNENRENENTGSAVDEV